MTTKGISKNSLIHTENGFKNVEDVVIGDRILNENNEFKKIVDIKVSSSNDTYIVNGMCFDEIVCSANQEFLVKERYIIKDEKYHPVKKIRETPVWKPIKDMEKGEYIEFDNGSTLVMYNYTKDGNYLYKETPYLPSYQEKNMNAL